MQKEFDKSEGANKTKVIRIGKDSYIVTFLDTNRNYKIEHGKEIEGPIKIEVIEDNNAGDISKGNTLDGSKEKPYQINCIEDLVDFSNKSETNDYFNGKEIILTKDLDFLSELSYQDYQTTKYGDINKDGTITPLIDELTTGAGFKGMKFFQGTFDGQNNTINNLYINSNESIVGFFKEIKNATIKNLVINGEIKGASIIGGIIAEAREECSLYNLEYRGAILENDSNQKAALGGILGFAYTDSKVEINKCRNKANIIDFANVGGIVGISYGYLKIINSYNLGDITARPLNKEVYYSAGGILGTQWNSGNINIENCYNVGKIENEGKSAYNASGGIIGSGQKTEQIKIVNCYNIGKTTAKYAYIEPFSGGIQGGFWYGKYQSTITNCYYDGSKSDRSVGGAKEEYATKLTTNQMQGKEKIQNQDGTSSTLVELLNKGINDNSAITDTSKWLRWKQGEDGYPTFE